MTSAKQYPAHIPINSVREITSFSKSHVYACIQKAGFPAPKKLGSRSLWNSADVQQWMAENLRDAGVAE